MNPQQTTGAGRHKAGRHRGFTLTEVVVTSVILFIGALGILTIIRAGRQVDVSTLHRRAARNIIISEYESNQYHFGNYNNLRDNLAGTGPVTRTVTMDPRGTPADSTDDLTGTLSVTVGAEQTITESGINILFLPLTMTVTWNEPEGAQSITLIKRTAKAE